MEFAWVTRKAALNLKKHKVAFMDAVQVFGDDHRIEKFDGREPYGEDRFVTIGLFDGNALVVVYAARDHIIRIISARKAQPNESRTYWENR